MDLRNRSKRFDMLKLNLPNKIVRINNVILIILFSNFGFRFLCFYLESFFFFQLQFISFNLFKYGFILLLIVLKLKLTV